MLHVWIWDSYCCRQLPLLHRALSFSYFCMLFFIVSFIYSLTHSFTHSFIEAEFVGLYLTVGQPSFL